MCGENTLKILVGNKCDLENERTVGWEELEDKAGEIGAKFLETSALQNKRDTIERLFKIICDEIKKRPNQNSRGTKL